MKIDKKANRILAIIPARGGSKRIKNKNLIDFFGKPMISYSIDVAHKTKLFDRIFVSTDSPKIAKVVKKIILKYLFIEVKKIHLIKQQLEMSYQKFYII